MFDGRWLSFLPLSEPRVKGKVAGNCCFVRMAWCVQVRQHKLQSKSKRLLLLKAAMAGSNTRGGCRCLMADGWVFFRWVSRESKGRWQATAAASCEWPNVFRWGSTSFKAKASDCSWRRGWQVLIRGEGVDVWWPMVEFSSVEWAESQREGGRQLLLLRANGLMCSGEAAQASKQKQATAPSEGGDGRF